MELREVDRPCKFENSGSGFPDMKRQAVILLPQNGMRVYCRVAPPPPPSPHSPVLVFYDAASVINFWKGIKRL